MVFRDRSHDPARGHNVLFLLFSGTRTVTHNKSDRIDLTPMALTFSTHCKPHLQEVIYSPTQTPIQLLGTHIVTHAHILLSLGGCP